MKHAIMPGPKMVLMAVALASTAAQANDPTVEKRLQELELDYEIDGDGDYKIVFSYPEEKRTQQVFVSGTIETMSGITIREIFAPAALVKDHAIDGAKALILLENASDYKIGGWEIRGEAVYFVAKVPEPISGTDLGAVIDAVAATADDMEIELTGGSDDL